MEISLPKALRKKPWWFHICQKILSKLGCVKRKKNLDLEFDSSYLVVLPDFRFC